MLDLKIINGNVVDFETMTTTVKDVNIKDGKIVSLGKSDLEAERVIDAKGKIVSPGFIDIHMHEEDLSLTEGKVYDISEPMAKMGVTTAVAGNCGANRQSLEDFIDYLGDVKTPINYMSFIGHNYLRDQLGIDYKSEATDEQIKIISKEIEKALDLGAVGISFGIEYSPGITKEEILKTLEPFYGRDDIVLAAHYRDDGPKAVESIKEMCEIGRISQIPFQISHLSSCSAFGNMDEALEVIEDYIDKGVKIAVDAYPYGAFSTKIGTAVFEGDILNKWGVGYDSIVLTEEPYKNVACTEEIFWDARENYPEMLAVANVMNEDEVIEAMTRDYVMVGSDGLYRNFGGHPRGAGTFPRVLGLYSREMGKLDLIDALYKMTLLPAKTLQIDDFKGHIKEGYDADIVIFDKDKIKDNATFDEPRREPDGISYVIVGGKVAVEDNKLIRDTSGVYIPRKGGQ